MISSCVISKVLEGIFGRTHFQEVKQPPFKIREITDDSMENYSRRFIPFCVACTSSVYHLMYFPLCSSLKSEMECC